MWRDDQLPSASLMLSGVGPAHHLRDLNVSVVANLPGVGRNLQDHLAAAVAYECMQPVSMAGAETMGNLLRYLLFKKGPLTSSVAEATGFVKTNPERPVTDLELLFAPTYFLDHGFANPEGHGFTFGSILLRPRSRGRITLRACDPFWPPAIQPNYLADESDLWILMEGVKLSRRLAQTKAFDRFRGVEVLPGSRARDEEAIAESIRDSAQTLYHPVGTCKMGDDPLAVVDAQLRVRGTEGLRVVDASIMPTIIGGHTNAPTIMIAEKAADLIKEEASGVEPAAETPRGKQRVRIARGS